MAELLIHKDEIFYLIIIVLALAAVAILGLPVSKKVRKRVLIVLAAVFLVVTAAAVIPTDYDLLTFKDYHEQVEFWEAEQKDFSHTDGQYKIRFVSYNKETKRLEICLQVPRDVIMFSSVTKNIDFSVNGAWYPSAMTMQDVWGIRYENYWLEDLQTGDRVDLTLFGVTQSWIVP